MSAQDKVLLVDIGNTYIKHCVYSLENGMGEIHFAPAATDLAASIEHANKVLLSSVANDAKTAEVTSLCNRLTTDLYVAKTEAAAFGFKCAYSRFQTLGVDRWLAMLGARYLSERAFAVIDIGTAMTCDIATKNQHLGGWIVPGYDLMRSSLINNTANVFSDGSRPNQLTLGKETEQCVNMGCLAAIQGTVLMAQKQLAKQADDVDFFITGGGQSLVNELKEPHFRFENNLVLTGLSLFAA